MAEFVFNSLDGQVWTGREPAPARRANHNHQQQTTPVSAPPPPGVDTFPRRSESMASSASSWTVTGSMDSPQIRHQEDPYASYNGHLGMPDPTGAFSRYHQTSSADRSLARLSISSVSTTSSGASSQQGMNSASPASTTTSSSPPAHFNSPPPPTQEPEEGEMEPEVKIEPTEEESGLGVGGALVPVTSTEVPGKRGRGRPRKHPIPLKNVQKITKGRSKTGCITCRRRKKKCDETKPDCMNCVKNAVFCEGYHEKTIWQPGRQKNRSGDISALVACPTACLPTVIEGIQTNIDRIFFHHFTSVLSRVLTLNPDSKNPFNELLIPMASIKPALMHSLLCVSGSHMFSCNKDITYGERGQHHYSMAVQLFLAEASDPRPEAVKADYATAITMLFCLDTIVKGDTGGEYKPHLDHARRQILEKHTHGADSAFNDQWGKFLLEFFRYHDVINAVTSLDRRPPPDFDNFTLPQWCPGEAGAMLGVADGLFAYLSKITQLRDAIRLRRDELRAQGLGVENAVDYQLLMMGVGIDFEIRAWQPRASYEQDPGRHVAAQLYRQCTWVYLYRTLQPSAPNDRVIDAVDAGLKFLKALPEESGTQSILLLPLFLLGCAAFEPRQRPEISRRFDGLYKYSKMGNIKPAHEVVRQVWKMMDAGDCEQSWDWERIMMEMGHDFLVT